VYFVPQLQTLEALENYLQIPRDRLRDILDFLTQTGNASVMDRVGKLGRPDLHLGRDSSLIRQHHANWRIEALKSLDRGQGAQSRDDLHYSGVVSLSRAGCSPSQRNLDPSARTVQSRDRALA